MRELQKKIKSTERGKIKMSTVIQCPNPENGLLQGRKGYRRESVVLRIPSGLKKCLSGGILLSLLLFPLAGQADDQDAGKQLNTPGSLKRSNRIEFDERLIVGQSLKSGAIYLFQRKDSEIQSMVKIRKDFREELLTPLEPSP